MPQVNLSPYPTAEDVLNVARAVVADAGVDPITNLMGDALTDDRQMTWILLQSSYKDVQKELQNNGKMVQTHTGIILNVPIVTTFDQGSEVSLGYTGFFDGTNVQPAPTLPADLILPLWMQQRPSGTLSSFMPDPPMGPCVDGLPSRQKTSYSYEWIWKEDKIFMCGALALIDLRIHYRKSLPKIVYTGNHPADAAQQLLILESENAIGYKLAEKFLAASGSMTEAQLSPFGKKAQYYLDQLITETTQHEQRSSHRRRSYSRSRRARG